MKNYIISKTMSYIKKNTNYNDIKLAEIKYGLEGLYMTLSKLIVISIVAAMIGIFKEMIIFILFFNFIRMPAFGIHASKSWMCWVSSLIIFILLPLGCIYIKFNSYIKLIICLVGTLLMFKNAPADTKKRPIVNKKRREVYKIIATTIALIFSVLAIIISNEFISNCLIFSIILENVLISPITYKIFKLPYNNYIAFLKAHPDFQS